MNWKEFDSDTMSAESPILWEKASITRLSIKTNIEKLGTGKDSNTKDGTKAMLSARKVDAKFKEKSSQLRKGVRV